MNFQERYSVLAQKAIKHLDINVAKEIISNLELLRQNPFPSFSKRCKDPKYRGKIFEMHLDGKRILYEIIFDEEIILIHNVEKNA